MNNRILIRADASKSIGTGHVLRCLTLANMAKHRGWKVCFVLREPDEKIIKLIKLSGHDSFELKSPGIEHNQSLNSFMHYDWLNVSQEYDANETLELAFDFNPGWIIIDHYALDATWHKIIRKKFKKILVLDDLGDRELNCDLLLDQNLGASVEKYDGKLLESCKLLLGPNFALLRDEFIEWREKSLEGRVKRQIEKILITMGGVDVENHTLSVLKILSESKHAKNCEFNVITGFAYPHTKGLHEFIKSSELKVSVLHNVSNMAEVMSSADLCIGAAGSTSWERCCMGLPALVLSIAENQRQIAYELDLKGAAISTGMSNLKSNFDAFFSKSGNELANHLSITAKMLADGLGAARVMDEMERSDEN